MEDRHSQVQKNLPEKKRNRKEFENDGRVLDMSIAVLKKESSAQRTSKPPAYEIAVISGVLF
jgi:hypothetical protein